MSNRKFYLFGEQAILKWRANDVEKTVESIIDGYGCIYVHHSSDELSNLLDEAVGWSEYTEITEEQFKTLQTKTQDNV